MSEEIKLESPTDNPIGLPPVPLFASDCWMMRGGKMPRYSTMLEAMEDQRICAFVASPDNTSVAAEEQCDGYFTMKLTLPQLRALGGELIHLADCVEKANDKGEIPT